MTTRRPLVADTSRQAFNNRGDDPVTVWTQVVLLKAELIECYCDPNILESEYSVKPTFPGEWGQYNVGGRHMRNAQVDLAEQRRLQGTNSTFRPTLHCRQDIRDRTLHEPEHWARREGREVRRPESEVPMGPF